MTPEQVAEVERIANQKIMENHPVRTTETSLEQARAAGVIALFGEKYGEQVRVVDVTDVSQELCGGTHVRMTSEIGLVKIVGETSVGANARRIEAVTSFDALDYLNGFETELKQAASLLKVPPADVAERTAADLAQLKELSRKQKKAVASAQNADIRAFAEQCLKDSFLAHGGYPVVVARLEESTPGDMRNVWDILRARMPQPGAAVLAAVNNGNPLLLVAASDEAAAAGFNAGAVIKAIAPHIKGGGGGKPTMAQAGGKDAAGLDAALAAARELLA